MLEKVNSREHRYSRERMVSKVNGGKDKWWKG